MSLAEKTTTQIVGPDGSVARLPTVILSDDEARTFRAYQKIKAKYGFREANYCNACWDGDRHDGMKGHVTGTEIVLLCRCRHLFYHGGTA